MGIFDDGIDPEEMGLIGSLSESFAEEERELARIEKELDPLDEPPEEVTLGPFRRGGPSPRRRRGPSGRPGELFLRYALEFNRGLKGAHDSMYGPPRHPVTGEPLSREVDFFGVRIENAHLVPDEFYKLLYLCLCLHRDPHLEAVRLTVDGTPVVNGREEFAAYEPGPARISINLRKHFESGARTAAHNHLGFALLPLIWEGLARSFLHEYGHALDFAAHPEPYRSVEDREKFAENFSSGFLWAVAKGGYLEPPAPEKDPYFGPLVGDIIAGDLAEGWAWARKQNELRRLALIYMDASSGLAIDSMKEYYTLLQAADEGDTRGIALKEAVEQARKLEESSWDLEEKHERSFLRALHARRRMVIDYRLSDKESATREGIPTQLRKEGPFLWIRLTTATGNELSVRLDRVVSMRESFGG